PEDGYSPFSLSACVEDSVDPSMQPQLSLVMNLLQVRDKRRDKVREGIAATLSGELLDKMQRYETGFGLERPAPLLADLTAFELVDRLDRILHTLKKISARR